MKKMNSVVVIDLADLVMCGVEHLVLLYPALIAEGTMTSRDFALAVKFHRLKRDDTPRKGKPVLELSDQYGELADPTGQYVYSEIAGSKADISLRTQDSSRFVPVTERLAWETSYWGSVYAAHGLPEQRIGAAYAVSGQDQEVDEFLSSILADYVDMRIQLLIKRTGRNPKRITINWVF